MTQKRILIVGYGQIGSRLGSKLSRAGHTVFGLRRRAMAIANGITPIQGNLLDYATLERQLPERLDGIYYILTPSQRDDNGYRDAYVTGLEHLISALAKQRLTLPRLIFVSSTAVYGQSDGQWVDEQSPTQPVRFNGERLVEAEAIAAGYAGQSIRVRFGGIYGPGREALIRRIKAGKPCQNAPPLYTNRIHEDDCVGLLAHVGELTDPDAVYLGVDNEPAAQCEVMDWLARELELPPAPRQSGINAGRRCCNARLLASGYQLQYPNYRAGYQSLLADFRRKP